MFEVMSSVSKLDLSLLPVLTVELIPFVFLLRV